MGTSPMGIVPQDFNLKSFWARPEGKVGIAVLALVAAVGIYEWGLIVPFLLSMMIDTVHLALLVGGTIAAGFILCSKRTWLVYRLIMAKLTGLIITIDPIGILKDRLLQMRKRREKLDGQISQVNASVTLLKTTIAKNHADADKRLKESLYAKNQVTSGKVADANEALRYSLQVKVLANKAGRLENANITYQQLLTKINGLYDFLVKWAAHLDAYIEDTDDTVKQESIKYKTLNTAYAAFTMAMRIVKGNASEEDLYNRDLEFLAEDSARKLGEIDDIQRVATGFMDNLDIQNGAISDDALKALDAYEAKLLEPGNTDTAFLLPGASTTSSPVPARLIGSGAAAGVSASASSGDDYNSLFK